MHRPLVSLLALGVLVVGAPAQDSGAREAGRAGVRAPQARGGGERAEAPVQEAEVRTEARAGHVAVTPVTRDGWHLERYEMLNERVQAAPDARLVFVGDSITQGWEANGAEAWKQYYGERNAVNIGISGDRTEHVLWRLEHGNVEGLAPEVVVVMIGTNNTAAGHTSEQIAEGITAIVTDLRARLPDAKILLLGVFPRGETSLDRLRHVNIDVNEQLAGLHDGEHVWLLDIGPAFVEDDGTIDKAVMPDLLHLSERGYRIWAEALEPSLRRLMDQD